MPPAAKRSRHRKSVARPHPPASHASATEPLSAHLRSARMRRRTTVATDDPSPPVAGRPPWVATNRNPGPSW